jgi:hypothetical protein
MHPVLAALDVHRMLREGELLDAGAAQKSALKEDRLRNIVR